MTEKCVLVIELPVDDFIISNSHGITCEVIVYGRDHVGAPYRNKMIDASAFVSQTKVAPVK